MSEHSHTTDEERLIELAMRYVDDTLGEPEKAELQRLLRADENCRNVFVDALRQHVALRKAFGISAQQVGGLADAKAAEAAFGLSTGRRTSRARRRRRTKPSRPRRSHALFALGAAAAVLLVAGYAIFTSSVPRGPEDTGVETASVARPAVIGHVISVIEGAGEAVSAPVVVRPEGFTEVRTPVTQGYELLLGDGIETGSGRVAFSYVGEATTIDLGEHTNLRLYTEDGAKRIGLEQGELSAAVAKRPLGKALVLVTPHAEAEVLATRFGLSARETSTLLEVTEGRVRLTRISDGASVLVPAGHFAVAGPGAALVARRIPGEPRAVERAGPVTLEAEDMRTKVSHMDKARPVPDGWALLSDGYVEDSVNLPVAGAYEFKVVAYGIRAAGEWPIMEIRIDQEPIAEITVDATRWRSYSATVNLAAGSYDVAVAFTNDYWDPKQRHKSRDLFIDKIVITQAGAAP